jgi:crotonobetainyl-CoA:carnitine CoA-transferase CaiB-like acyl-CoA transferase
MPSTLSTPSNNLKTTMSQTPPSSPYTSALSGLKVLDLTRVLAGPWCGQLLADMGAAVIKVEKPHAGDDTRAWGPPYAPTPTGQASTEAAYYLSANRGKQSLTCDIASPAGQAIVRQLVMDSDVLLENYKVGQLRKYGLDYASLSALNPRLIYCSITGFGQTGPDAGKAGYDFVTQGLSGLMSITGEAQAVEGASPQKTGVAISDLFTGVYSAVGVLAAVQQRHTTGRGQHIDMALLDVCMALTANMGTNYLSTGTAPVRMGNAHANIVPYQTFVCSDGHLIIACGNDGQFAKLCAVLGLALLPTDERFATNPQRVRHRELLVPMLSAMFASKTRAQWIAPLDAAGVPCGAVNNLAEAFAMPQVLARGAHISLPHPTAGQVQLVANPIKMSASATVSPLAPPLLGQHTDALLAGLGYDAAHIAQLRAAGTV